MFVEIEVSKPNSDGCRGIWLYALSVVFAERLKPFCGKLDELRIRACLPWHPAFESQTRPLKEQYSSFVASLPRVRSSPKKGTLKIEFLAEFAETLEAFGTEYANNPMKPIGFDILKRQYIQPLASAVAGQLREIKQRLTKFEGLDLSQFLNATNALAAEPPPDYTQALAILDRRNERAAALNSEDPWRVMGVEWERFHKDAKTLLDDPWFWDCADDYSPHGNDTGADILEDMRRSRTSPEKFLVRVLDEWRMHAIDWEMTEAAATLAAANGDSSGYVVCEEAVLAVAFGEIKLRGRCSAEILRRAQASIRRRLEPAVLDWWIPKGRENELRPELKAALEKMSRALEQFDQQA